MTQTAEQAIEWGDIAAMVEELATELAAGVFEHVTEQAQPEWSIDPLNEFVQPLQDLYKIFT